MADVDEAQTMDRAELDEYLRIIGRTNRALAEVREQLRRPPCWGPNEQGDLMVDMTVEAYERDLDRLVAAALSEQAE